MKMECLRSILYHLDKDPPESRYSRRGRFHCWSGTSESANAIIEDEDGYIYEVSSDNVQFYPPYDALPASRFK